VPVPCSLQQLLQVTLCTEQARASKTRMCRRVEEPAVGRYRAA